MYPSRKKKKSPPRALYGDGFLIHRGNNHLYKKSYLQSKLRKSIENFKLPKKKSKRSKLKISDSGRDLFKRPTTSPVSVINLKLKRIGPGAYTESFKYVKKSQRNQKFLYEERDQIMQRNINQTHFNKNDLIGPGNPPQFKIL